MAEQVGSIVYTAEVSTTKLMKGEQAVNKAANNMQKDFERVEASSKKAGRSFNNLGANAAQLGFQVQDAAVQLQAGTNAFTVIAQQGSQAAAVLGPGGAVVGAIIAVTSAVAGALIPTLLKGGETFESFAEKQKLATEQTAEFVKSTDRASKNAAILSAVGKLNNEFSKQQNIIDKAEKEIAAYTRTIGTATEGQAIIAAKRVSDLGEEIDEARKKQAEYSKSIEEIFMNGLPELTDEADKAITALDTFTDSLQIQVETLGLSERGLALYTAEQLGATQADKDAINEKYDIIEAYKTQQAELRNLMSELDEFAKFDERQRRNRERLAKSVSNVGLTRPQSIERQYQNDLEILRRARDQQIITEQEYANREIQIQKNKVDAIKRYQQQQAQNNMMLSQSTQDTLGALGNAFGNFANIAAQGGKESFESYKKLATAQALISTFLAANNALATPAPFPIPQILAGSIAALGLANVANIRNQQYSGARQFGGPVTSGKSYLVGERGPEIFTPNGSGSITSNKDSFGGGGVTVNVNNYASNDLSFDVSKQGEIIEIAVRRSVDAVAGQINSGQGKVPNAMRQSGTFRTDARRGR